MLLQEWLPYRLADGSTADHAKVRIGPSKSMSDGATKESGRGRLSLLSHTFVAVRNDLEMGNCKADK